MTRKLYLRDCEIDEDGLAMRAWGGGAHSNDCDTSVRVFAMVRAMLG